MRPVAKDPRKAPIAKAFKALLAEHDLTAAEVERRLKWSKRYLSRILNGDVEMKMTHVLDALDAAGIEPRELWCRLCEQATDSEIQRRVAALKAAIREGH